MSDENPRALTLKQKLHAIMLEVPYIKKDKKNEFHRYNYASEAAIKDRLHDALTKYGVLFTCDPVSIASERERPTKNGSEIVTTIQFHYCFEDVDSDDKREGSFFGTGADASDKGVYKAITGAIKYCLTTKFLIPTGDDPENDQGENKTRADKKAEAERVAADKLAKLEEKSGGSVRPVATSTATSINDGQRKRMYALAKAWAKHEVKALLASFNFDSSTNVTADKYEAICEILERGPEVTDVEDLSAADPFEYPAQRVRWQGKLMRPNAEASGWEEVK